MISSPVFGINRIGTTHSLNQSEADDGYAAYGVRDGASDRLTQQSVGLEEHPRPNGAARRVTVTPLAIAMWVIVFTVTP
jgi:hypothetical protein